MESELSQRETCDLAVIGNRINGAGIAWDAAGRGLRVVLCAKVDFGQHTSSDDVRVTEFR